MREIRFQRNGSLHTAVNRQRPKSSLGSEGGVDGSIFYIYPRQWERGSGADMQKRRRRSPATHLLFNTGSKTRTARIGQRLTSSENSGNRRTVANVNSDR